MYVFISPQEYYIGGDFRFKVTGGTDLNSIERRVFKRKTLDGEVYVGDFGVAEVDRNITLVGRDITEDDFLLLRSWYANYTTLNLALPIGFYTAAPYQLSFSDGECRASFMLKARLDSA